MLQNVLFGISNCESEVNIHVPLQRDAFLFRNIFVVIFKFQPISTRALYSLCVSGFSRSFTITAPEATLICFTGT